jgi:aspartyl aminopeptidase
MLFTWSSHARAQKNHQPILHKGPVIKYNANQRYATNAVTAFLIKELARRNSIPIQVLNQVQ